MSLAQLISEMSGEAVSTLASLQVATREGGFEVRTSMASYAVSHAGKVYLFPMKQPLSPDKDFGKMLAYVFTASEEYQEDVVITEKAKFKVVDNVDAILKIQDVEGPFIPWLLTTAEQITEHNELVAQSVKEEEANPLGKTVH
jgi:hypothetical protein